jgi:hypothetical protein
MTFRWPPKHKVGEIDQSHPHKLSLPFNWAATLISSTKAAQRTQRRLPDQLWASIAWHPCLLSSPPSLPQKHACTDLGVLFPRFNLFWKDWRSQNGLVLYFSFAREALSPEWHGREWPNGISTPLTRCFIRRSFDALPLRVLSLENRRAVLLTWWTWCVRLRARIWQIPPPRCLWCGALKSLLVLYSRVPFKCLFGWNQVPVVAYLKS